jgi:ankyrin repeat protein
MLSLQIYRVLDWSWNFPQWLLARALGVVFLNGTSPTITLSFPRVVPPDTEIAICIREGNSRRIKELFADGSASPADIIGPYGITTLSLAILYGQHDVCRLLVGVGAHQYAPNHTGLAGEVIAFWRAFGPQNCSISASVILVDAINLISTDRHLEALHHSLSGPFQECEPFSRLHKSVLGISSESVEEVVRQSRQHMNDTDILGRTALHWAACQSDANLVERILYCGADPDIQDRDGKTPLHLAAGLGNAEVVASLVAAGANLELRDCIGYTPLHIACLRENTYIIRILLDFGSDIEATNELKETPLLAACLGGKPEAIEILCDKGANIEHYGVYGNTPLSCGIKSNSCPVVEIMIIRQARVKVTAYGGKTLLHLAAQAADEKMLDLLASSNIEPIDPESLDEKGYTARQYLMLRPNWDALLVSFEKLVRQAGRKEKQRRKFGFDQ